MSEKQKKYTTFYITSELKEVIDFLVGRDEIKMTLFLKRALQYYLEGKREVDANVLITRRTDPQYIKRDNLFNGYIEIEQWEKVKQEAEEKSCKEAHIIFQALLDYCVMKISEDNKDVTFEE